MLLRRKLHNYLFSLNLQVNRYLPNWLLNNRKPHFLIIGSAKCATTFLKENLRSHPCVSMPKYETDFFSKNQDKGFIWYTSHFWQQTRLAGEKSPSYIYSTNVHKDLYDFLPNAKLILLIREPTKRAYSNWNMRLNNGSLKHLPGIANSDFSALADQYLDKEFKDNEIAENPFDIFHAGKYINQIESLLSYYPKESLFLRVVEEVTKDNDSMFLFFEDVCDFLSVPYEKRYFSGRKIRSGNYEKNIPMSKDTELALNKMYQPYNERLFNFLGREIKDWS